MADDILEKIVNDLIGESVRVYKTGDVLSEDFVKERINIELSENSTIVRIWLG